MILGIFTATSVLGVSTLYMGSTIYGFMPKIIARITQDKKNILVPRCGWSSNWCSSESMILLLGLM
jgi:hypothetical protein